MPPNLPPLNIPPHKDQRNITEHKVTKPFVSTSTPIRDEAVVKPVAKASIQPSSALPNDHFNSAQLPPPHSSGDTIKLVNNGDFRKSALGVMEKMQQEKRNLAKSLEETTADFERMKCLAENQKSSYLKAKEEAQLLQTRLKEQKKEHSDISSRLNVAVSSQQMLRARIEEVESRKADIVKIYESVEVAKQKAENALEKNLKEFDSRVAECTQTLSDVQLHDTAMTDNNKELEQQLENSKGKLKSLEGEHKEVTLRLETEVRNQTEQMDLLKVDLKNLEDTKNDLQKELSDRNHETSALNKKLEDAKITIHDNGLEYSAKLAELEGQITSVEAEKVIALDRVSSLLQEIVILSAKKVSVEAELVKEKANTIQLSNQVTEVELLLVKNEEEKQALCSELQIKMEVLDKTIQEKHESLASNSFMKQDHDTTLKEVYDLKLTIEQKRKEFEKFQVKYDDLTARSETFIKQRDEKIQCLTEEIVQCQKSKDLVAQTVLELEAKNSRLAESIEQLQNDIASLEEKIKRLNVVIEQYQKDKAQLSTDVELREEKIARQNRAMEQYEREIGLMSKEVQKLEENTHSLNLVIEQYQNENCQNAKDALKLIEVEKKLAKVTKELRESKQEQYQNENGLNAKDAEKFEVEKKLAKVTKELRETRQELDRLRSPVQPNAMNTPVKYTTPSQLSARRSIDSAAYNEAQNPIFDVELEKQPRTSTKRKQESVPTKSKKASKAPKDAKENELMDFYQKFSNGPINELKTEAKVFKKTPNTYSKSGRPKTTSAKAMKGFDWFD